MPTTQRSLDSVYEEIAGLTGNRAELERQRYLLVKAIRAIGAILTDSAIVFTDADPLRKELENASVALTARKALLWIDISNTDAGIQKLTDLAQNGAFNENR